MNIFFLDRDPLVAANDLDNTRVPKMIVESAQMLANCFSNNALSAQHCPRTQKGNVRKHSYYNHPCSKWVRASQDHFVWLILHASELCKVKEDRWPEKGSHFTKDFILWCYDNIQFAQFEGEGWVDPPQCMPDKYKGDDTVQAYRRYYIGEKLEGSKWTNSIIPPWIETMKMLPPLVSVLTDSPRLATVLP